MTKKKYKDGLYAVMIGGNLYLLEYKDGNWKFSISVYGMEKGEMAEPPSENEIVEYIGVVK